MRAPIPASLLVLVLASAGAQAGGIYQWKDAKGVTHYTDTPPPGNAYKQRDIRTADPVATPAASKGSAESPACAQARQNIALLGNKQQNLQLDSNGDGKPDRAMNDQDRANQLALAQATLNASCSPPPAASNVPAGDPEQG